MGLVKARCTVCDGDLQVEESSKELVCKYCGSTFMVEEAINHYNTTINNNIVNNINTNQVVINQVGEEINVSELVDRGIDVICKNEFGDNDAKIEIGLISRKIAKKDPTNKFIKLFKIYEDVSSPIGSIPKVESDKERKLIVNIGDAIYKGARTHINSFYSEQNGLASNWPSILRKDYIVGCILNIIALSMAEPSLNEKTEDIKELLELFLPHIVDAGVKAGTSYYYSKDTLDDMSFKDVCSKVEMVEGIVSAFRSLIPANSTIYSKGKTLYDGIKDNISVILTYNYIYGIHLIKSAYKLSNRDWTEESVNEACAVTYKNCNANRIVVLYPHKVVIRFVKKDSTSEVEVKKEDIMFINSRLNVIKVGSSESKSWEYDLVYKLDSETYTLVHFATHADTYSPFDNPLYKLINAYTVANEVNHTTNDNSYSFKNGMNGLKYVVNPNPDAASSGGCYVATCVYGSYNCPEVWVLRRYRDDYLENRGWGRAFIKLYYSVAPTMVKTFGRTKLFNKINKSILDKKIQKLRTKGYTDEPYEDLK